MADTHLNRIKQAVSGTPGTGAITLGAAATGFKALGASQNAQTFSCLFLDGAAWEIATGCTYTHSGTTLTRGTREDSSTGAAISLTSAATVSVILPASRGVAWDNVVDNFGAEVRSALLSGVETTITDSAIVNGDSVLTAFRKLIARCANALNRTNHTGTQAISTVTNLQTTLDAKATLKSTIAPTGAVTLTASESGQPYNTGATSRAFTVSAGIPLGFDSVYVDGPCTWAAAGGVTVTDSRQTGQTFAACSLVQTGTNTFRLVGTTT